jgi:hypothetical protein
VNTISLALDLRMITYSTLTAGARLFRGTIPKPAARTAVDWKIPATTRIPAGRSSISLSIEVGEITGRLLALMHNTHGVPISNTMNETKSVELSEEGTCKQISKIDTTSKCVRLPQAHVNVTMTRNRNQVCVDGKR